MNLKIYSVRDSKVEAFSTPFFQRSKGEALRNFIDQANDRESALCKHAEDYTLFELGEWDHSSGVLIPHPEPVSVAAAWEVKKESTAFPVVPQQPQRG